MKKIILLLVIILLSSCAAPIAETPVSKIETKEFVPEESTLTATQVPTLTPEPTATPTQTLTPTETATSTPEPNYTKIGEKFILYTNVLGWQVLTCGDDIQEEDIDAGIVLFQENPVKYFCDLLGYSKPEIAEGEYQYLLIFREVHNKPQNAPNGLNIYLAKVGLCEGEIFWTNPQDLRADELTSINTGGGFKTAQELREYKDSYSIALRIWPITEEEAKLLAKAGLGAK